MKVRASNMWVGAIINVSTKSDASCILEFIEYRGDTRIEQRIHFDLTALRLLGFRINEHLMNVHKMLDQVEHAVRSEIK